MALAPSLTSTLYFGMRDSANNNSTGVWKSTNSGSSWNQFNNGLGVTLPNVSALLVDPANVNHVHAGTSAGYYITTDGGTNWSPGATGAGNTINALAQTTTHRLVATTATGIYLLPVDAAPTISADANPSSGMAGTPVTIGGTGFNAATGLRVLFGGIDGTVNLGASNSTSISVTVPAHAVGAVDVTVINPDGQIAIRTNGFTYCATPILSPISANFSSAAGTGTVQVTSNCSWTATAPGGSFVTITGGSPGTGNGTVTYSVASNGTASSRTTTLTIAGKSFVVTQSASAIGAVTLTAAASSGQVALSWTAASGASSYQILRGTAGTLSPLTTVTTLTYTDSAVSNGVGYIYQVYANSGTYSNVDLAVPMAYTDPSLAIGNLIRAAHFSELRTAVNAARVALGWSATTFTDPSLGGLPVKRIHLIELRSAVDAVRAGAGITALSYTDPTITQNSTLVRATHIVELRNGLN